MEIWSYGINMFQQTSNDLKHLKVMLFSSEGIQTNKDCFLFSMEGMPPSPHPLTPHPPSPPGLPHPTPPRREGRRREGPLWCNFELLCLRYCIGPRSASTNPFIFVDFQEINLSTCSTLQSCEISTKQIQGFSFENCGFGSFNTPCQK